MAARQAQECARELRCILDEGRRAAGTNKRALRSTDGIASSCADACLIRFPLSFFSGYAHTKFPICSPPTQCPRNIREMSSKVAVESSVYLRTDLITMQLGCRSCRNQRRSAQAAAQRKTCQWLSNRFSMPSAKRSITAAHRRTGSPPAG